MSSKPLFLWVLLFAIAGCDQQQDLGSSLAEPCAAGLSRCGGRCVNSLSDPAHCGGCGLSCAADRLCQTGACVSSCTQPYSACGAACVILYQDDENCGACGKTCSGSLHCDNATCLSCSGGNLFCRSSSTQAWRCVNVAADRSNCGSCGVSCASGQQCASGTCR